MKLLFDQNLSHRLVHSLETDPEAEIVEVW